MVQSRFVQVLRPRGLATVRQTVSRNRITGEEELDRQCRLVKK